MSYPVNPLIGAVAAPPVAEVQGWIAGRIFPHRKPLLDVSQAVPGYPPDRLLSDHLAAALGAADEFASTAGQFPASRARKAGATAALGGRRAALETGVDSETT